MGQYQEITIKVGIASMMSSGCDEESHNHSHNHSDVHSDEGFAAFLNKMIDDLSDEDSDDLDLN